MSRVIIIGGGSQMTRSIADLLDRNGCQCIETPGPRYVATGEQTIATDFAEISEVQEQGAWRGPASGDRSYLKRKKGRP